VHAVLGGQATGQEAGTRRRAHRRRAGGVRHHEPGRGEPIEGRGLDDAIAVGPGSPLPVVVGEVDEDVRPALRRIHAAAWRSRATAGRHECRAEGQAPDCNTKTQLLLSSHTADDISGRLAEGGAR